MLNANANGATSGTTEIARMLTVRGTVTSAGQALDHVQYLGDRFVLTEFGRTITLHSDDLGGRFLVDAERRMLRPIDPGTQRVQIEHLRELVGEISVHRDPDLVEVGGFTCHRYRICNDSSRLVIAAEACCTRIDAVGLTALQRERRVEAILHPFALPLEADELVISSMTRTYANGFQHTQTYKHASLAPMIEDLTRIEAFMAFPVIGR